MSNMDSDDELLKAYRKASAEDAGAPGEALRRAIHTEAAAAARRRMPAANDSRFHWRAVAGIAVVGIGLMLWRQVDQPLPSPRVAVPEAERATGDTIAQAEQLELAAAPTTSPAPVPAPGPAPAPIAPPMTAAKAESEGASRQRAELPIQRPFEQRAARSAASADSSESAGASGADSSAAQRLQRFFPGPYASRTPPRSLWLVLDETGNALARGQLAPGENLAAAATSATPALGGRQLGPWESVSVPNLHGLHIDLSVARAQ